MVSDLSGRSLLLKGSKRGGAKVFRAAVATDYPRPGDRMIYVHRKHNNKSNQNNFFKIHETGLLSLKY